MAGGRPTDYKPSHCQVAVDCGKQGMSKAEIASKLDVSRQTLYLWCDTHPEFSDAIKRAEDEASSWFSATFRDMGKGEIDKAVPVALIFQAKNQLPEEYRDKRELDVNAEVGVFELDFTGYKDDAINED
jgi:hypothetical protein